MPLRSSARQVSSTALCSVTCGDDVVALVLVELDDALDRQVVRLGGAAGEDDVLRLGADQAGDLLAAGVDGLLGLPAEAVGAARGVAEVLGEVRQHRLEHPRIDRRRGVVVHVDCACSSSTSSHPRSGQSGPVRSTIRPGPRRVKEVRGLPGLPAGIRSPRRGSARRGQDAAQILPGVGRPRRRRSSSGVPATTIRPPSVPALGSEVDDVVGALDRRRGCARSGAPCCRRRPGGASTSSSRRTSSKWRPVVGSSST